MPTYYLDQYEAERRRLRIQPGHLFVGRSEFCELLVSNRQLERIDFPKVGVRGLFEPASGQRYLIEEEKLFLEPAVEV